MRELRAQVDAFEESWKKNQAVDTEIWCDKIPDGDWLERLCECPGVPGSAAGRPARAVLIQIFCHRQPRRSRRGNAAFACE